MVQQPNAALPGTAWRVTAQHINVQHSAPQRDLELQRVQAVAVGGAPAAPDVGRLAQSAIACTSGVWAGAYEWQLTRPGTQREHDMHLASVLSKCARGGLG